MSSQCNHGEVRLVGGSVPSEGRVEICINTYTWGTVCDDGWDDRDASIVCRQLGYGPDGKLVSHLPVTSLFSQSELHTEAEAEHSAHFGRGSGRIVLDNVRCNSREITLLECGHNGLFTHNCGHWEDAGVRCRGDQRTIKNIKAIITDIHNTTVSISWELQNYTVDEPISLFEVECSNERHSTTILESNRTFTTQLRGLLPSITYNCCVSAVYGSYAIMKRCTPTEVSSLSTNDVVTNATTTVTNTAITNAINCYKHHRHSICCKHHNACCIKDFKLSKCDWWSSWVHHCCPFDFIGFIRNCIGLSNHQIKTE